jgi:hypothetical protein
VLFLLSGLEVVGNGAAPAYYFTENNLLTNQDIEPIPKQQNNKLSKKIR